MTTHDLFIGRMEGDTQRNFDGLIDEAAIWNRGLSSDEVAALYAAGSLGLRVPQCAPPPDAMTHWFKAENRADDAVAGLVGALEGGAAFTAGRVGQAFSFDGVNDLVTYTNFPNLGTNSFSVSLWYRADTTSASAGNMKLVNKGMTIAGTPNNAGFQVRLESSKLAFTLSDSTSWIPVTCAEPGVGVWHHVAAIADRTNKLFRLYVDGSLAAQTNYTTLGSIDTNIRFAIGALDRRPGSTALAEFFNGLIDEVLFFDRPLTASEVASLHAAGSAGMCPTVSFDVTSAFGIANGNPNGVWSYGWMPTDFSAFNLYTHTGAASCGGGPFWNRDQNDAPPIVWKNIGSGSAWGVPPGWLSLHPGGGTEPSVIRWTAPATGVAHVVGRFLPGDGAQLQVAVRLNNQPWWNATDAGSFDLITNVTAGATVDFAAYGGYAYGNTPVEATVTLALSEAYPPTILVQPTNQVVTATRDVTLAVSAFGSEPLSYQWFFTNAPLAGATNAVLSFPLITTNRSGTYFVAVSNFVGAVTSQWAVLTVLPDTVGPAVTNFVPLGAVNTNVGRLLVQFNERINVDSLTTADVSVVTPRGALDSSAFTIQPVAPGDGTAFEVLIPSQSLEGDYAVRIGPFITDLAGNLMVGGSLFESQAFTSQPGHWRLLGQAAWNSGGFVRLTPATVQQKGSLVLTQALPAGPFVLSFDFRMSNGGGVGDEDGPGADGIALNFLPHVPGTPFFYGEGSNAPAFHLFLDSYGHPVENPGDTNGDHIAIGWTATNASVNKAIQVKVPQRFIDTGLWHAEVEFDGAGLLTAHIISPTGAVTHVSQSIPAAAIPPQFYFGFGAYTGGGYADQDVDNVLIRQLTADGEYRATFTIDKTGPSITSVSPSGIVSNTMTSFEVNFDSVYAASSLSAADVTLSGPNAPAVQSVSSLSATSFRVTLAGPLPQGDFTITIGPEITDLAGNPMAAPFTANLTVFLPDLAVQNIAAPATALAGQPLNLTWIVTNRGPGNVTTAWKSRVQLATNAAGAGAITLGTFTATNLLAATMSCSPTGNIILPATAAGNRWLVVTADADDNVFENTETNNTLIAATPITLLTPDLALVGLGAPASAQFGQTISVNWAVTNVGTAPAPASWSDRIYLSATSNSISGTTPLATVAADASPLQSSAGYTRSTSVTLPFTAQSAPGTFWLVAFADYADVQAEAAEANNLRSIPISLVLPPMPDLAVVSVTAPTNVLPNQAFDVSWTVTNLGSAPAAGVWSETLMVSNTVTRGSAQAMFTFTNDLATGAFVSRTQAVTLPFSGPAGDLVVLVQLDSRNDVIESVEGNNVGTATNRLTVPLVLSLQLATSSGAEGTSGLKATVTRNGAAGSGALTVTITNSDDTELSTPANVIIPPEATTANFSFKALNDDLLDGPQTVTIGVSATGYQPSQAVFTVLDTNVPSLSLVLDTNVVREGQVINATVTRDLVTGSPLFVSLVSSSPSQLGVQSSVTIPAGEASASFLVFATDDSLVEASQTYEFAASAPGFNSALADVLIHDNDAPRITLMLAANVVSENAGPQAVLATVTRSPASAQPLTLQLESTNTGAARVPASVMFGAYQTNASFAIAAVNDALLDGTQTTEIRAWITDSITGEVLALGAAALLDVTDDDGPALTVAISPKLVKEGLANAANVTLSRNTPATNALTVHLSSSDVSEATVPATAVIPLNQVATTVPLTSVADGINDGNQTVVITASAPDYAPGAATVTVSDSDLPDLFVASISVPAAGETETYVNATYRVANQGFVPSTGSFVTRLYLSRDAQVGDDTLMGQYRFTGSLAPGQYFEQILPVRLPQTAGDYWVVVQTDAEGALAETLEDNNLMISATAIHAAASYSAYVQTTVTTALAGTPVPLKGRATNEFGVGVAYKLVNIHVQVRGTERVIAALTDADGNFSTTFQPLPNEAGSYQIFATHPGVSSVPAQDTFSLLGMKASSPGSVRLAEASSVTGTIVLENLSDVPLTGLAVAVTGKPSNVEVTTSLANGTTLGGRATKQLGFAITAVDATYTWGSIVFEVTSAEGAVLWIELGVTIEPMRPRLVTYPTELVAGMVRGRQTTVGFDVVNVGGRASGPIQVVVPVTTWLQVVSTNLLPSLEPGQTNHVSLLLSPPSNLPLAPYTGSLALNMTNGGLSVPFSFRAISDAKGDLLVTAVDEYTYYAEGAPRVTNAIVTVSDPVTHNPITNG
ncbi:MAG TPA: CARDB domain-containing protein, partial [Verrucomicrobiae bacterium]